MVDLHEIVRLMFVLYCGGLFWMALVFLIEKISKGTELQASVGFGVAVLVLSAYLLIGAVRSECRRVPGSAAPDPRGFVAT